MKVILTGCRGQLGTDSHKVLGGAHETLAVDLEELDITNREDVKQVVQTFSPDLILNCAAYTQVDNCETERTLAWNVNVKGPENLAVSAEKCGARVIHISTDYVFDGSRKIPEPYLETDIPNPVSYYGTTKLESERAVQGISDRNTILRTAWLYGIEGANFLKTMLRLALKNPYHDIKVVDDQYGSPTWSYRLARQIAQIVETNSCGTFHATSEGYCSWYELATYFLDKMAVVHRVVPCTTEEYPTKAIRPKNSILENLNLKRASMNTMTDWQKDVDSFVSRFRDRLIDEARQAG